MNGDAVRRQGRKEIVSAIVPPPRAANRAPGGADAATSRGTRPFSRPCGRTSTTWSPASSWTGSFAQDLREVDTQLVGLAGPVLRVGRPIVPGQTRRLLLDQRAGRARGENPAGSPGTAGRQPAAGRSGAVQFGAPGGRDQRPCSACRPIGRSPSQLSSLSQVRPLTTGTTVRGRPGHEEGRAGPRPARRAPGSVRTGPACRHSPGGARGAPPSEGGGGGSRSWPAETWLVRRREVSPLRPRVH
jgi:hypothetical protein